QITDILFGGESYHYTQAVPKRDVEQGPRRHRMWNSDGIDAVSGHQRKVTLNLCRIPILTLIRIRPKSTITHAFDIKLVGADVNKLSDNGGTARRCYCDRPRV